MLNATGTIGVLNGNPQTWTGNNTMKFGAGGVIIRNPASTFATKLEGGAVAANRTLNLPVIAGTDTLATLGLAQSWTSNQDFGISGATDKFDGVGIIIRNPAHTFTTAISNPVITANQTLNLPLLNATGTIGVLNGNPQTWTGNNTMKFGAGGVIIRNPASTFATKLEGGAVAANRTLNLPVITQTETLAVQPQINFSASSNKTGSSSTTGVMLGDGIGITPTITGRVEVTVSGYISASVANVGCDIQTRYGTGAG